MKHLFGIRAISGAILAFALASPLAAYAADAAAPDYGFKGDYYTGSAVCSSCHSQLKDEAGRDVSIDAAWRGTMMGNSARDPFWRMVLRGELIANPNLKPVIEGKCSACHMPLAKTTAAADGKEVSILDGGFASPENALHNYALDSVSCTLCHQITPDHLGKKESYTGHYTVASIKNKAEGKKDAEPAVYGPYDPAPDGGPVMAAASGYHPKLASHIQDSALCGTCHNLYTPFVKTNGELGAYEVPEQVPYTEWENSAYNTTKKQTCQQCHMPEALGGVTLSVTGGEKRPNFNQHSFVGGNYYILDLVRQYGPEMQATGSPEEFANNVNRTLDYLRTHTATVKITDVGLDKGALSFKVNVKNLTGHKFPTAYPARRAWLHTTVFDSSGKVVFESGKVRDDGLIFGNDEDEQDAAYEPHYDVISAPNQVQIYQAGLVNSDGVPTTTLLFSAKYAKDSRLLPDGFDKAGAPADVQVYGEAKADPSFVAGGDTVTYKLDLGAQGPFTVETELLYQSMNYRWVKNLALVNARAPNAEAKRFLRYYDDNPNRPALVAQATTDIGGVMRNSTRVFQKVAAQ